MKKVILIAVLLLVMFFILSCVSFNVKSQSITEKNASKKDGASFFIQPVKVTAFNFYNDREIAYIMDKKLGFSLRQIDGLAFHSENKKGDLVIAPEIIIKRFESGYSDKGFYMIILKVLSGNSGNNEEAEFRCQYNGPLSIFDADVQDAMIKKLMAKFKKFYG